jgi:DNA-directed RNA polymerase subunit E'/Rpb7
MDNFIPPIDIPNTTQTAEKEERKSVIPEESQKRLKEGWEVIKEVLHDEDDLNEITINETAVEAKMKKA